MLLIDPVEAFKGKLLFAAPHMDDEVLACGGTMARLPHKQQIHVVYASDGARSPYPVYPWQGFIFPDLPDWRVLEAYKALAILGIPKENVHFFGFPDGKLKSKIEQLVSSIRELVNNLRPDYLFIPFRYDKHPDHLALNWAAYKAVQNSSASPVLIEYFVYYRWRLLPGGDVRKYIHSNLLRQVTIEECSSEKKRALQCYESQTTRFFEWQDRAILPPRRVEEISHLPEIFLQANPNLRGPALFSRYKTWIRLAHGMEPLFKNKKEQIKALYRLRQINHVQR
jgi:LmbE family N-acetylglucosaminyl deacetylase